MTTGVSKVQHLLLNGMDDAKSPYTGFYNVTYYDDKATVGWCRFNPGCLRSS